MPDREGKQVLTCDCPDAKKTSICLHQELIEQFHRLMPPPMVDGEDPESCFISEEDGNTYFSIATKSGSASRQSQKRTIVQYTSQRIWRCTSCITQK